MRNQPHALRIAPVETSNPILTRLWRGPAIESVHRGAWVLCRADGTTVRNVGARDQLVFARSSTKSFQALPLIETGAADRFNLPSEALATALASHSGEPIHRDVVAATLRTIGLSEDDLRCGPQRPFDSGLDAPADRLTNNCSGKHAGFLAVAQHIGEDPANYLEPTSEVQQLVKAAVAETCGLDAKDLGVGVDGCSAPTFQLPLSGLATGVARIANPQLLAAERRDAADRFTAAAAAHPELVAGTHNRICTDLIRVTDGRLFAKIGAEAVYVVGVRGADMGLAIKIDDGNQRGLHRLLIEILHQHDLIDDAELAQLEAWADPIRRNWDGLEIGRVELAPGALG